SLVRTKRFHQTTSSWLFRPQFVDPGSELLSLSALQVQFAVPVVTYAAFFVHQVDAGPICVFPALPDALVVIDGDGKLQAIVAGFGADAVYVGLVVEFRRMHADDRHVRVRVLLLPSLVDRIVMLAIDATKRPEMQHDHFSAERSERQRLALEPL